MRVVVKQFEDGFVANLSLMRARCNDRARRPRIGDAADGEAARMTKCQALLAEHFVDRGGEGGAAAPSFQYGPGAARAPAVVHQFDRVHALAVSERARVAEWESLVRVPEHAADGDGAELFPLVERFAAASPLVRRVSAADERLMEAVLAHVDAALTAANVTYMLDGGSLIGSMLHHGRIPWDDDLDIYIFASDAAAATDALTASGAYAVAPAYRNAPYLKIWGKEVRQPRLLTRSLTNSLAHSSLGLAASSRPRPAPPSPPSSSSRTPSLPPSLYRSLYYSLYTRSLTLSVAQDGERPLLQLAVH